MNHELSRSLEKLTRSEQEKRFKQLADRLGIANPKILDGDDPQVLDVKAYEEYVALKRILGYID